MVRRLLIPAALALLCGCADSGLKPGEGFVDVTGGRVWYRIVGSGTATPLLVLHGGPGAPSYYLKPLAALADERPVVFYDQLGAGHSESPADTSLWNLTRFVNELREVREALGLKEVHIFGHSWGTMLAVEYMLESPPGVQSLILASPSLSVSRWTRDAEELLRTLPDSVQVAIRKHEAAGTTDSPEYQGAVMQYYALYLTRTDPWTPDIDSTFAQFSPEVYGKMWGPSEFTASGTLATFERAEALPGLHLPILFTAGRYDEAVPATVEYYASLAPDARVVILENSAHMTMQDEPERYVEVVRDFLREVDASR